MDLTGLTEKSNNRGRKYYEDINGKVIAIECSDCKEIKLPQEYNRNKLGIAGRSNRCRDCHKKFSQSYYKENQKSIKAKVKKYRAENKELVRRRDRIRNADPKRRESRKEYKRNWLIENREQWRIYCLNREALKLALPNTLTYEEWLITKKKFKGGCALTGASDNLDRDHVIPLSTGHGGTTQGNIIPLHAKLNRSKSARNIFDWFKEEKEHFGLSQQKFDELIEYLADINDMTVEEYEDYVRWCHDNPRSINEINTKEESDVTA